MKSVIVCSDGSSRRNGKPNCIAGYGAWSSSGELRCGYETASTSQRGELNGIYEALRLGLPWAISGRFIALITDSAYIANCLKHEWYTKWQRCGWITSTGTPVKNKDLWVRIVSVLDSYPPDSLLVYQIKGHIKEAHKKKGDAALQEAYEKFRNNNDGAAPPKDIFMKLVEGNALADYIAQCGRDIGDEGPHRDDIDTVVYECNDIQL